MKKRILLVSGEIDNGLSFQRGHLFFRLLRDSYDFVCKDFDQLDHTDCLYADLIVIFHPYAAQVAQFIHRTRMQFGVPVICDLDDMTDNLPIDHPEYFSFKNGSVPDIIRLSDHIVVSTDVLKQHWGHLNKNMSVIQNQIDLRRYKEFVKQPKPYHAGFVVGWTGSQSHRPDLYNTGYIKGLRKLMRERDDVRAYFHILCPQTLIDEFGSRVIFNEHPVDYLDYPSICFTYPFDVCAVPLYDHPFNHAKSDLRLLDMAPFKIPVVASNLSAWDKHSERAILTNNTPEDWYEALKWCYETPKELDVVAENAHEYVLKERTAEKSAALWDTLFKVYLS